MILKKTQFIYPLAQLPLPENPQKIKRQRETESQQKKIIIEIVTHAYPVIYRVAAKASKEKASRGGPECS